MQVLFLAACLLFFWSSAGLAQTGAPVAGFESLDRDMQAVLARSGVPGAAVAIARDGRLVFARGYGVADLSSGALIQPDSQFRIGSISKTITAVALLELNQTGRLDLDAKVYAEVLAALKPPPGAAVDPRIWTVTVRQLLHHTGGVGRDTGEDPLNGPLVLDVPRALGVPAPAAREAIVRYVMGQPLHFDPGTKFSYSNYGFMLLARVVEHVSGMPYETFVRERVFAPMGIRRAALGRNSREDRLPNEVVYYEVPRPILELSLIPGVRRLVPRPYANFEFLAGDGCGQWVASPVDLVRFIVHVEGSRAPAFLEPGTFLTMLERPRPFVSQDPAGATWYALGTGASEGGGGRTWVHAGAWPGSLAAYASFGNGMAYAFAVNAWPPDPAGLIDEVSTRVARFCAENQRWPSHDLFPDYYPEN